MADIRNVIGTGNRESFTFRPSTADELIRVYKIDGCIGDTKLKQIQIEEGRRATDFVAPSFVESQVSGLFKDLRDIRVRMDDPNSDLWGKIHANNEALLVEYHNGRLSSKLGISPEQHIQAFRDELSGDYATFEQRLNGMQTNIRNGAEQYTDTALANLKRTEIQSLDGRISTATQTLDAHATRLQGVEGSVSSHTQTLQVFQNKLEDAEGNISSNTQLIKGFNRQVEDVGGRITQVAETIDGVRTTVKNQAEQYTDTALANLKRTEIQSLDGRISTATQTLDAHATRLQGVEGSVSSHTQTLQVFQNKLEDAEGNISSNTQLIKGFNRQVEDVGGRITQVAETIDGVRTTVKNQAEQYTDTALANLRRTEIKNIQGSVSEMEQSIENFRRTLQTASGDFSQVEQTLQGIREEFEAGDREVQASFERTLDGMETRIKNSNKSYTDTAIAGLKQTEIQSLDGRVTTATQTVNGFSKRIQDAEGAISSVSQSVQGFNQRVQGVEESYSQLSQTVGGLTTTVHGHNGLQSRVTQLADQLSSKVSSDDFSTHLSQYSDTIWAAVRSRVPSSSGKMTGSEIISAIRLDRSGVKISGSKVQITGDTSIDNAVIKNSHIASLNADKITTGTLNAARVRVINLDANNITGNKTNFVQSNWNNINDRVQITSAGIEMINSGAWRKTIYTATGLEMFRGRGAGDNAGVIGYFKGSDYHANDEEYFMDGFGDHHTIGIGAYGQIALGTGNDTSIRKFEPKMVINKKYDGIQTNKIAALKTEAGFTISAGTARGEWASIIGGSLNGRNRLTFAQSIATLEANDKLDFYASAGARVMRLTYKSVDINGSIKYSSDERLKTNIQKSKQNSLSQILNIEYANFDWKDGSKNQFGFIAQQVQQSASELITTDSEDYLRYDETRYVHTIGHALQQSHEQLLERIENLEEENELLKEKLNEAV